METRHVQSYDTAKVGSSALLAALERNLKAEVAKWLGQKFASIFNDYAQFVDTLNINGLMEEAIYAVSFPGSTSVFTTAALGPEGVTRDTTANQHQQRYPCRLQKTVSHLRGHILIGIW